jgi:6-phosphogluconolactonase
MTQTLVYVSCAKSREIDVFALDTESGHVRLCQRLDTPGAPQPMRFSADQRVLYAGAKSENSVLAFAIDPDSGELTLLGSTPASGEPTYVSADRAGRVAFCASYAGNSLSVFPLDGSGVPGPASQIESPLTRAHACLTDATNQWLLVPLLGEDAIRVFRLGDDGRLTPNDPAMIRVRPGSGPRHLVFSPDNRRVHCLNELDCTIDGFDFDANTGCLVLTESVSILPSGFTGKPWSAELRATPDGRFLYATERTASVIAAFGVDKISGRLRLIDHYPTETQPRGMGIDPSGKWLVAVGQLSGSLTVYALDPETGRLSALQRYATGENPICVEILTMP